MAERNQRGWGRGEVKEGWKGKGRRGKRKRERVGV
jgi:hypothetical protein